VHLEDLRRHGMTFPASYMSLAEAYVATGQPERAREALAGYAAEHPDRAAGYENLGFFELTQSRTDEALAAFDKAAALHPSDSTKIETGRFVAHALRDDWAQAEAAARRLTASDDPRQRWEGGAALAMARLYQGDLAEARRLTEEGAKAGHGVEERVGARLFRARLESDLGRDREALAMAERVLREKVGEPKLLAEAHAVRAVCLARLGRDAEAEKARAEVEAFFSTLPPPLAEPGRLHLDGQLALARGDHETALRFLEKAAALVSLEGIKMDGEAVEIRHALARAALGGGDAAKARRALVGVVEAGPARVMTPVPYVRSLARLAALEEQAGRPAEARSLYGRYLQLWGSGQIDRDEVARARERLAALPPATEGVRKPAGS
jgi:tetratricopeptide (TPR) repeat protein